MRVFRCVRVVIADIIVIINITLLVPAQFKKFTTLNNSELKLRLTGQEIV